MALFIIVIINLYICVFFIRRIIESPGFWGGLESFIFGSAIWSSQLVIITEILSLFDSLQNSSLLLVWSLLTIAWLILFLRDKKSFKYLLPSIKCSIKQPTYWVEIMFVSAIGIMLIALFLTAYIYPPNSHDTMTYHLARVMHWISNKSVGHYAANFEPQIIYPAFSEYVQTLFIICTGNDSLTNFAQYYALLMILISSVIITKELGGDKGIQLASAGMVVSYPMIILHSTNSNNDLVLASWVISALAGFLILFRSQQKSKWFVYTSLCISLGIFTKSFAIVLVLPIIIGIILLLCRHKKLSEPPKFILILFLATIIINSPHWIRNIETFGNPLGSESGRGFLNQAMETRVTISNLTRALSTQFPVYDHNQLFFLSNYDFYIKSILRTIHSFTKMDENDPRTSITLYLNPFTSSLGIGNISENNAGSPLHTTLLFFSISLVLVDPLVKKLKKGFFSSANKILAPNKIKLFLLLISCMLLVQCSLLRWSIMDPRLQLPIWVAYIPFVTIFIANFCRKLMLVICVFSLAISPYWLINNPHRPFNIEALLSHINLAADDNNLLPNHPLELYFTYTAQPQKPFIDFSRKILERKCEDIGLDGKTNQYAMFEYPLWVILKSQSFKGKISSVNIENQSKKYFDSDFQPCAYISQVHLSLEKEFSEETNNGYYLYLKQGDH